MNILLLSQFFSTTKGGGEYVFTMIAKMLAKNGHNVWVITNKMTSETYDDQNNIHINFVKPVLEYKGGLPLGILDNLRYSFNAFFLGLKLIKKGKIDIIHSNNFSPSLVGSFLSLFTSKPHIMTVHDVFSLYDKDFSKKWAKQANVSKLSSMLIPFFEKLMVHFRHEVIHTVSDASKDDLIKLGEKKPIYIIENSIEYSPSISKTVNPFQIIYVGRLVFYKNFEVLLKAIPIIKQKIPKIKLVIVGDGPYKENLKSLIKKLDINDNVELKGYLSTQEKVRLTAQSTALVLPSIVEGFGLVILEAFSQRRPVIVPNVRPMSDIVQNNETGFVLDPHDEKVWAESIIKILQNPTMANKMGEQGKQILDTRYTLDSMYEKLVTMYNEVLGIESYELVTSNDLVSVIIPVYNSEKFLRKTIESVLNQTYDNMEIIAVNDGSTDDSLKILQQYSDKIMTISQPHQGLAAALNTGIKQINGKWFKLLSHDDTLYPNAIQILVSEANKLSENTIVYSNWEIIDANDKKMRSFSEQNYNDLKVFDFNVRLLDGQQINVNTTLIPTSLFDKGCLLQDLKDPVAIDYDFFLRAGILYNTEFHLVTKPLLNYRVHPNQLSHSNIKNSLDYIPEVGNQVLSKIENSKKRDYQMALKKYQKEKPFRKKAMEFGLKIATNAFPESTTDSILVFYLNRIRRGR